MYGKGFIRRRALSGCLAACGAVSGGRGVRNSFHMMAGGVVLTLLFAALMLPGPAAAAETTGSAVADIESAAERPTAPVTLDGVALFRVVGVSAYPAERRAQSISSRIKQVMPGAVNTEVAIELPGGAELVSVITKSSAERLHLSQGPKV